MKIYDITQELFEGRVYPGDPRPGFQRVLKISDGAVCNLTELKIGAHNATHMDAPYHFYDDGKTIEQLELSKCIGPCTVIRLPDNDRETVINILEKSQKRLLLKGKVEITLETAKLLNQYGVLLIGVEGQSVGPEAGPMEVHLELLKKEAEMVILEGIVLEDVPEGDYFLSSAPLKLGGSDGAPCRAVLLKFDEKDTCIY